MTMGEIFPNYKTNTLPEHTSVNKVPVSWHRYLILNLQRAQRFRAYEKRMSEP